MLGANLLLPIITMVTGASFGMVIDRQHGLPWGAAIGFGVGCAILVLVWLLFAILKKIYDEPSGL